MKTSGTSDEATRAIERIEALWGRERATTQTRFAAERRERPLRERVARGLALDDLRVDETDVAPGGRTLVWLTTGQPGGISEARIGPGDPIVLWREAPGEPGAVRATVARKQQYRLGVMVDGELPEWMDDPGFRLDAAMPLVTFARGSNALRTFRATGAHTRLGVLRETLFGARAPRFEATRAIDWRDTELNATQRAAVALALAARDVALIHGPPGTGKTRTLVELIVQAVTRGERVLASAASNAAVDVLAARLAETDVPIVRLGHPARVADRVLPYTLDAQLEATEQHALARRWVREAEAIRRKIVARSSRGRLAWPERRALQGDARRLMKDARRQLRGAERVIMDRARVVCATAAGADTALLAATTFDLVVLDEATQAPAPIALIAFARAERIVMAGDPHQLPPTVIDPDAAREGLSTTLFERLMARGGAQAESTDSVVRMLTVQHRMHRALMAFPSTSKYAGRLRAAPAVAERTLGDLGVAIDPLRPGPLVVLDTAGTGWQERQAEDDPSIANPDEAARTTREVRRLLGRGLAPADLAVITPYLAQVRLLREALTPEVVGGLEIDTVDGFQGREKEAIVVDLVRSNDGGTLGFLTDTRRMNVALTRAKRFLLVIGDSATLSRHPYYAALFEHAERTGVWLSAWADDAPPFVR